MITSISRWVKPVCGLAAAILLCGAGYTALTSVQGQHCARLLARGVTAEQDQYFGDSVAALTRYFALDYCRGKTDLTAIKSLMHAKRYVQDSSGYAAQQSLAFARIGSSLQRDPDFQTSEAVAAVAAADWQRVLYLTQTWNTAQGLFMRAAAFVRLKDWDGLNTLLASPEFATSSGFRRALLVDMLDGAPVDTDGLAATMDPVLQHFARSLLRGGDTSVTARHIRHFRAALSDTELSTAVSLLVASGRPSLASLLLWQPDRSMPPVLLRRYIRINWQIGDMAAITAIADTQSIHTADGGSLFALCVAQRLSGGHCQTGFQQHDYERRYGIYAAQQWAHIFTLMQQHRLAPVPLIDGLTSMPELIADDPVAASVLAALYARIGEYDLARLHTRRIAGVTDKSGLNAISRDSLADRLRIADVPKHDCGIDATCMARLVATGPSHPRIWQAASTAGVPFSPEQRAQMRADSPRDAVLWRLAAARALVAAGYIQADADRGASQTGQGTDKRTLRDTSDDMSKALLLLRPVFDWAPDNHGAHNVAALAYGYFEDMPAALSHLASAVRSAPDSTVTALRTAITVYRRSDTLSADMLVNWWTTLTRLELAERAKQAALRPAAARQVMLDRYAILAAYAGATMDPALSTEAYEAVLRINPRHAVASNNLAVLLMDREDSLGRAKRLVDIALASAPGNPDFRDTRDQIEARRQAHAERYFQAHANRLARRPHYARF